MFCTFHTGEVVPHFQRPETFIEKCWLDTDNTSMYMLHLHDFSNTFQLCLLTCSLNIDLELFVNIDLGLFVQTMQIKCKYNSSQFTFCHLPKEHPIKSCQHIHIGLHADLWCVWHHLLKYSSWMEFSVTFVYAGWFVLMTDADNIVWKTACFIHVIVVLAGAFYMSIVVIQLMLQHIKNPFGFEEGRYVTLFIH